MRGGDGKNYPGISPHLQAVPHVPRLPLIPMFRWCSYCQNLIGEVEPLSNYRISHGMCLKCHRNQKIHDSASDHLRARSIFSMLVDAGKGGSLSACDVVIEDALDFGLKSSDIIVGILHPALYRIGELWERGEITVADEHRFTAFALAVIDRLELPEPLSRKPLIVLANHPDSLHDVGLRILQVLSWEHGVPCTRIPAGTSREELLNIASEQAPALFGLSVSLMETIPDAVDLVTSIASRIPDASDVVMGGHAFRRGDGILLPEPITVVKSIDEYLALLQSIEDVQSQTQRLDEPDMSAPVTRNVTRT